MLSGTHWTLRRISWLHVAWKGAILANSKLNADQQRAFRLLDLFDKKKAKERQQKLKEEASKGYWDDFKELKDSKGKIFAATGRLVPAEAAPQAPNLQVENSDGTRSSILEVAARKAVTLLTIAFRNGAEEMLMSWSKPFAEIHEAKSHSQHLELSIVDSVVMSCWPFKNMIMRGGSSRDVHASFKPTFIFHFGSAITFAQSLQMSNRLTGYAFLLDSKGRVRWRGSGMATAEEAECFVSSSKKLFLEDSQRIVGAQQTSKAPT